MIDLSSKLRGPEWGRVVAELARPAPDDQSFYARLVSVLHQVSGARQAVLFSVAAEEEAEPRALVVWPPAGAGQQASVEADREMKSAARSAAAGGRVARRPRFLQRRFGGRIRTFGRNGAPLLLSVGAQRLFFVGHSRRHHADRQKSGEKDVFIRFGHGRISFPG